MQDPFVDVGGTFCAEISELEHIGGTITLPTGETFKSVNAMRQAATTCRLHGEVTHWEFHNGKVKIFND
jgi:hypothetical protein